MQLFTNKDKKQKTKNNIISEEHQLLQKKKKKKIHKSKLTFTTLIITFEISRIVAFLIFGILIKC